MTPRIAQRMLMGLAVVGALLFTTGCDNPVDPPAATVGDIDISRDDVFNEANALASVPGDPFGMQADTNNALNGDMVASVLSGQIASAIYEYQGERLGVTVDDAAIADARADVDAAQNTADLPDDLKDDLARRNAMRAAVEQRVTSEQWWTDADVERYHGLIGEQVCVKHILVATTDEADDILDQLRGGADFAEMAAEHSSDQGSAANGGDLGCQPRNTFIGPFSDALDDAQSGELIGPVSTEAGVHVILVDEAYHEVSLDEAREDIESSFADPQGAGWAQFVLKTTKVTVDPRFGSWDQSTARVLPPEGARPASSSGAIAAS